MAETKVLPPSIVALSKAGRAPAVWLSKVCVLIIRTPHLLCVKTTHMLRGYSSFKSLTPPRLNVTIIERVLILIDPNQAAAAVITVWRCAA